MYAISVPIYLFYYFNNILDPMGRDKGNYLYFSCICGVVIHIIVL